MNRLLPLLLLAVSAPSLACDWTLKKKVSPMDDVTTCWFTSPSAKVALYKHGTDAPRFIAGGAYSRPGLEVRIDDNPAVYVGDDGYTSTKAHAILLPQLMAGQRIRASFRDYPHNQAGDAPICDLPALLASCGP